MVRAIQGEPYIRRIPIGAATRSTTLVAVRSISLLAAPAVLLVGVLSWPLFFTEAVFNEDWINHLWFIWHQSAAIRANHVPSLFVHYSHGVFYPEYAFYAGTVDALAAMLSIALGNSLLQAYILTWLMAFAAVYGGWYWIARMAGLGRWWAHVPGLVFVTSAYYITSVYARGGWPEILGVSSMTLMMASGLSVLRAERLRPWPAAALVISTLVFFGSHNITMLWGSTVLALAALAIIVCVPQARREVTRKGVLRVVGLAVPAALVNAWFLLPAVTYKSEALLSAYPQSTAALVRETLGLVSVKHLFTISRASATSPTTPFALSLPILEIGWVLVSIAIVLLTRRKGTWTRIIVVVSALTILVGLVMTHADLLLALPNIYANVQYSYRLESYILQGLCAAIVAGLVLAKGPGRRAQLWRWSLVPLVAVSVVGAIQQTGRYPTDPTPSARLHAFDSYLKPPLTKTIWPDYLDPNLPQYAASSQRPARVDFPPESIHNDHVSVTVHLIPGQLVYSNLAANPHLVEVHGAKIVGIDPEYNDVLEITPSSGAEGSAHRSTSTRAVTETISVSTAQSLPIVLGRLLTLGAMIFLAAVFIGLAIRGLLARPPGERLS
jgi:hypothetical protein